MDQKLQYNIALYPELRDFILFIIRIIETVYERGRVDGLKEPENLVNDSDETVK